MTTGKYFNRRVIALDSPHVGYVLRETDDRIIIFGDYNYRFDVPKSGIIEVSRNVILNMDFSELASKYKVDRNASLPIGEPIDKINDEESRFILSLLSSLLNKGSSFANA
jgi:hypothetical protein